ncbi:MAG: hypothetical protein AB7I30_09005 [Isosphaeraceae bacterium]
MSRPISRRRPLAAALTVALLLGLGAPGLVSASVVLNLSTGPANQGYSSGGGFFLDLTASGPNPLLVTGLTTTSLASANQSFTINVYVRSGTGLGGTVSSGPGSSSAGWSFLGSASATQGGASLGVSLPVNVPGILVTPGQTTGVAFVFQGAGPWFKNTSTPGVFSDGALTATMGEGRSVPFNTVGFRHTGEMVGSLTYVAVPEPGPMMLALPTLALVAARSLRRRTR